MNTHEFSGIGRRILLAGLVWVSASALAEPPGTGAASVWGGLSISDFGAKGDGKADDTAAFQSALNAAAGQGGRIVVAPAGEYRLDGVLTIPDGVTLEGVWRGPHTSQLSCGTTLLAYAGRDHEDGDPLITLRAGATLKGITVYYPEQKVADIHPYPWTIQGRGQNCNVIDVTIANAYNGIDYGTYPNEGHHLRNISLCALRRGVLIDQCTDVGRVENVHIHNVYWWRANPPGQPLREQENFLTPQEIDALEHYTTEHLEGFIIGRTDWEFMNQCFVIWSKVGYHFIQSPHGGGMANAVLTQSGSDIGPLAVKVDALQAHAGVAFENCQFMSGLEVGTNCHGPVKLSNCGFWGQAAAGSQMVLGGDGTVTLTATHFYQWDRAKPCIEARRGSLLIQNCDFMDQGTQIFLGKDLTSAVIMGNRLRHGTKIVKETQGDVQIFGNVQ
jgi:hypothetical protein